MDSISNLLFHNQKEYFISAKGLQTCADPESFVRGGPTLTFFFFFFFFFFFLVDEGRKDPNTTISIIGPPAKRHLKWRFDGVSMVAHGRFVIF